MNAQRESRGIAILFNLDVRWGWWSTLRPGRSTSWERNPVPIVLQSRWTSEPVWTDTEILVSTGIWSPDLPALNRSVYRLRCPCPLLKWRHWYYTKFEVYNNIVDKSWSRWRFDEASAIRRYWSEGNLYLCKNCSLLYVLIFSDFW